MFISPILWAPQQPSEDFHFLTLANNALGLTHKYTGGGGDSGVSACVSSNREVTVTGRTCDPSLLEKLPWKTGLTAFHGPGDRPARVTAHSEKGGS